MEGHSAPSSVAPVTINLNPYQGLKRMAIPQTSLLMQLGYN